MARIHEMARALALGLVLALAALPAQAQDDGLDDRPEDQALGVFTPPPFPAVAVAASAAPAGADLDPTRGPIDLSDVSSIEPPRDARPRAGTDLRLRLELPCFGWQHDRRGEFVRQVTLTRLPPGSLIIRYEGMHGFAARKVTQRLRSVWLDSLEDLYDAGTLDDEGLRCALRSMEDAIADQKMGGRWWDRTWWEHMPEAKGGAPATPLVYTVGERLEVARLGPLRFTNDFKGKLDKFTLSLEPDSERIIRSGAVASRLGLARDHARIDRNDDSGDQPVSMIQDTEDSRTDEPLLRLLLDAPDEASGLLSGTGWKIRIRPAVRLNITEDPMNAFRDLSLRVLCEWSRRPGEPSMVEIQGVVRFDPKDQDLRAGVQFTLLFF